MSESEKRDIEHLISQLKESEIIDVRSNAVIELGTKKNHFELIVPALIEALNDENWLVRVEVAKALGQLGYDAISAIEPLTAAMKEPRNRPKRGVFYESIQLLEQAKSEGPPPSTEVTDATLEPEPQPTIKPEPEDISESIEDETIEEVLEEAVEDTLEDSIEDVIDEEIDDDIIEDVAEDIAEEVIEIGDKTSEDIAPEPQEHVSDKEDEIIEDVLEEAVEDTLEDSIEEVVDEEIDDDIIEDVAEDIAEEVVEIEEEKNEITEPLTEKASIDEQAVVKDEEKDIPHDSTPEIDKTLTDQEFEEVKELLTEVEESLEESSTVEEKSEEEISTIKPSEETIEEPTLETVESKVVEEIKESVPLDDVLEFSDDEQEEEPKPESSEKKDLLTLADDAKPTLEDVPTIKMSRTILKLIIVGDEGVGKTSLLKSYGVFGFQKDYKDVIGADFVTKHLDIEGENFALQMWDFAGKSRESINQELFYKGTKGALLVFDVTRKETFDNIPNWFTDISKFDPMEVVIIGNKIDLRLASDPECVTTAQGQELATKLSTQSNKPIHYFETNANDSKIVDDAFKLLVNKTIASFKQENTI